jgi:hypothetical protein
VLVAQNDTSTNYAQSLNNPAKARTTQRYRLIAAARII